METTSPFKEIQALQEEQREGWMPAKSDTPETDAASMAWYGEKDAVSGDFARKLERERNDLTQRLRERQESFQAQLIRIEDGWREKLVESRKDADRLYNALSPVAWLHSMAKDGEAYNEAEQACCLHESLTAKRQ